MYWVYSWMYSVYSDVLGVLTDVLGVLVDYPNELVYSIFSASPSLLMWPLLGVLVPL